MMDKIPAELYPPGVSKSKKSRPYTKKGGENTPFRPRFRKLFPDLFLKVENVGKKRHVACALDGLRHLLLVLERNAGVLARNDLIELGNVLLKEFGVFIVDRLDTCLVDGTCGLNHGMGR